MDAPCSLAPLLINHWIATQITSIWAKCIHSQDSKHSLGWFHVKKTTGDRSFDLQSSGFRVSSFDLQTPQLAIVTQSTRQLPASLQLGERHKRKNSNHSWRCEAPKIAFSWFITPITMVYGTYNYSYWGESKPTYNWGGPHCGDVNHTHIEGASDITTPPWFHLRESAMRFSQTGLQDPKPYMPFFGKPMLIPILLIGSMESGRPELDTYMYVHTYIYVHICIYTSASIDIYIYIHMCVCDLNDTMIQWWWTTCLWAFQFDAHTHLIETAGLQHTAIHRPQGLAIRTCAGRPVARLWRDGPMARTMETTTSWDMYNIYVYIW